jgi:hypothetical protein
MMCCGSAGELGSGRDKRACPAEEKAMVSGRLWTTWYGEGRFGRLEEGLRWHAYVKRAAGKISACVAGGQCDWAIRCNDEEQAATYGLLIGGSKISN